MRYSKIGTGFCVLYVVSAPSANSGIYWSTGFWVFSAFHCVLRRASASISGLYLMSLLLQ